MGSFVTYAKTIFCDIDGTLVEHKGIITKQHLGKVTILPGVLEAISEWNKKGYTVILTTGRKPSTRVHTEMQLAEAGILYDQLIMGLPRGTRVLINDNKSNKIEPTAMSVCVKRNVGIGCDLINI